MNLQKGGQKVAKGNESNISSFGIIATCFIRISMFYQSLLHKYGNMSTRRGDTLS